MESNKLLWVDDEIELLKSHIIFLSEKGYEVDTATNGEDAISSVKERRARKNLLWMKPLAVR